MDTKFLHVTDVKSALQANFMWVDYAVFVAMLSVCVGVGVYFGFVKKQTSSKDYLMGGGNMAVVPVAFSLVASFISGISLVGTPTEVYMHGTQYLFYVLAFVLTGPVLSSTYLPVFQDLELVSTYGYLEKRYDRRVRVLGSVLFTITTMGWLPIVVYVPALAFNLVTGVNIHIVTPIVCCVCIFYTCVGGLKAVVWTDVIQTVVMTFPMVLVVIKGSLALGGFGNVFTKNWDSGRIETPSWSFDFTDRHTIWSIYIGGTAYSLGSTATSQSMMQRFLSLPNIKAGRQALWGYLFGITIITLLCGLSGLVLYAYYHHCDPLDSQLAEAKDQMLPLLVMDVLGDMPGLPGLFVAGVFSAALSSLSTGLNSMAAVVLEDFWKPFFKEPNPRNTQILMRAVVVILGTVCVGLVFVVEKLGTVLQLTMSLSSATVGPHFSIVTMGMFMPWVDATSALGGAAAGLATMWWVAAGAQVAQARGHIVFPEKPRYLHNCTYEYDAKIYNFVHLDSEITGLYRMSYMWYCITGFLVTTLVALLLSSMTKKEIKEDLRLYAPVIRKYLVRRRFQGSEHQPSLKLEDMKIGTERL